MEDRPKAIEPEDMHTVTPAGESGVQDLREGLTREGRGRVRDAAGVVSMGSERQMAPKTYSDDSPSAEDPYGTPVHSDRVENMALRERPPTYERDQGTADPNTGGSSDPHDFMTHANSGNETEQTMNENQTNTRNPQQQGVDGFTDTEGATNVSSPDPGVKRETEPLDPKEYAEKQKEARSEEHEK